MVSSTVKFREPEAISVPVEVEVTDESIEQSLNEQYGKNALVLRESVSLERIEDNETYERVCSKVKEAAANIRSIEAQIEPFRAQRHAALQRIYAIKAKLLDPLEAVKTKGSKLIAAFQIEQEHQRRLAEEAERQEQMKRAEAQQAQEASTLFDEGREAEAVAMLDNPVAIVPVVGVKDVPRVSGISKARERYLAEVTDLAALVKGIVEGKVSILAVQADMKFLNKQADSMKTLLAYPGVKVVKEIGLSSVRSR